MYHVLLDDSDCCLLRLLLQCGGADGGEVAGNWDPDLASRCHDGEDLDRNAGCWSCVCVCVRVKVEGMTVGLGICNIKYCAVYSGLKARWPVLICNDDVMPTDRHNVMVLTIGAGGGGDDGGGGSGCDGRASELDSGMCVPLRRLVGDHIRVIWSSALSSTT